jgi:hypothetical protein
VIGNSPVEIAVAGVSIATMHETGGVSWIGSDRLVMIGDGFLVIARALPLVGTIAVNDGQVVLIEAPRVKGACASIDCGTAGSSDALLGVVGRCSANEAKGGNTDECAKRPTSAAPCDRHDCPLV